MHKVFFFYGFVCVAWSERLCGWRWMVKVRCFFWLLSCKKWGKSRLIFWKWVVGFPPGDPGGGGATWVCGRILRLCFLEETKSSIKTLLCTENRCSLLLFRSFAPLAQIRDFLASGILEIPNGTDTLISVLSSQALSSLPSFPQLREFFPSLK